MILTSTVLMYASTYLNSYVLGHVFFSETRAYMALLMGGLMAIVMLSFMLNMYGNARVNALVYGGSAAVMALSLWLVRSQATVGDVSYMKAMIPHHSIAILTSERARLKDPRVKQLAAEIIEAQRKEIAEMKAYIADIESGDEARVDDVEGGVQAKERGLANSVEARRDGSQDRHQQKEGAHGSQGVSSPRPEAARVPQGYRVEVAMSDLTYPTSVEFDERGRLIVAESGYSYGDPDVRPRILRRASDGSTEVLVEGGALSGPVNDLLWHEGELFVSHRGRISTLEDSGELRDLVADLPSQGDHHNNQLTIGPDGKLYFGQGTATNSGVVGLDNLEMGWLEEHRDVHDVSPRALELEDRAFETEAPFSGGASAVTHAFQPFGQAVKEHRVEGHTKANGTILRMNTDGSELEVFAWGLRNPYGLMWSPEGKLYCTENGFDVRGSRPIANDQEDIYVIEEGAWYGWPDHAMGLPVTDARFQAEGEPKPTFLLAEHPQVERPWLNFPKHSSITKMDFAPTAAFGEGQLFVAFFGHMSPMTGEAPDEHGGHRVVRIDPQTRSVETFFGPAEHGQEAEGTGAHAEGQGHRSGAEAPSSGPGRLVDVRFAPDGNALYIADFGVMKVEDGPRPVPHTGVIWRVVPE